LQELGLRHYARVDGWVLFPLETPADSGTSTDSDGEETGGEQPAASSIDVSSAEDDELEPSSQPETRAAAALDAGQDAGSSVEAPGDGFGADANHKAEAEAPVELLDDDDRLASDEARV
jgi:hypothetical protein